MFSILIPTFNNFDYLKLCLKSIKQNSFYNHNVLIYVNEGQDETVEYLKNKNYLYIFNSKNMGLCYAYNELAKLSKTNYIVLAQDDMYFCKNWDIFFDNEIKKIKYEDFFLSGTMIQKDRGIVNFDCGDNYSNFDEKKLNDNLLTLNNEDFQGTSWMPSLIPIKTWNKVNGFSEEYFPGVGADPDFNMKLWNIGCRIFKGLGKSKVYHFYSRTVERTGRNNGSKTFLLKWRISIKFFRKHFMRSGNEYNGPLEEPNKNLIYYLDLLSCKLKYLYTKVFG
jgi:GT2 family glycosyltransferase